MIKIIFALIFICQIATADELSSALQLAKEKKYEEASKKLFNLSRNSRYAKQKSRIKYILGLILFDMRFYQNAAYEFIDVVKAGNSEYKKQAISKLSISADILDDEGSLTYSMGQLDLSDVPSSHKDKLFYRVGEYYYKKGRFSQSIEALERVVIKSPYYLKAKYYIALSNAEENKLDASIKAFQSILKATESGPANDSSRVSALIGIARILYQKAALDSNRNSESQSKYWEMAIEYYRRIPKDNELWHDALFELSWAQMRAVQFRSVLSNFHSLHSAYYEDFYLPESLMLRSIVYMYICQYDEMEKTLQLFDKIYLPVARQTKNFLKNSKSAKKIFNDVYYIATHFTELKEDEDLRKKTAVPFLVAREVLKEASVKRNINYINNLDMELINYKSQNDTWRNSPIGNHVKKRILARLLNAQKSTGRMMREYMVELYKDLRDLFKQRDYAGIEMLTGKRQGIKEKIAGKGDKKRQKLDDDNDRDVYVQSGYEYWPFQGEYWLDEIGNYFYLGTSSCDKK